MKIVADANLADVEALFGDLGELLLIPGRDIAAEHVRDADALLVRSVTRVDATMLGNSRVSFVGTATSGTDHIDIPFLMERGIVFADAKGSNANAVADYCVAAIACAVSQGRTHLSACRAGIIGYGHVGRALAGRLEGLGLEVLLHDPPLLAQKPALQSTRFTGLEEIFNCDIVSLHVPLVESGPHPTRALVGGAQLQSLPPNGLLINTCRGGVVDEAALIHSLQQRADLFCACDVWENEPDINAALATLVALATPHIAGYSRQAKQAATSELRRQFHRAFDLAVTTGGAGRPSEARPAMALSAGGPWSTILELLPLQELSAEFVRAVQANESRQAFDSMRARLSGRNEFACFSLAGSCTGEDSRVLSALGLG